MADRGPQARSTHSDPPQKQGFSARFNTSSEAKRKYTEGSQVSSDMSAEWLLK